ncbi:MAG: sulfatase-like hydrolase/transferase [Bacteroidetes bacterium]|nr:sulfatase-like hydrolase/transferase [Bacteroidota bacterium]
MGKKSKKGFRIYDGDVVLVTFLRLLVVLIIFFLSRVCFYLFNLHYFSNLGFGEVLKFFIIGLRFDISAILILNFPVIILNSLPFRFRYHKVYKGFVAFLFYFVNIAGLMSNFIDLIYFRFTLKRLTADIFSYLSVGGDFDKLVPQFLHDFWYVLVVWASLSFLMVWLASRFSAVAPKGSSKGKSTQYIIIHSFLFFFIIAITVIGIRGGLQLRPIGIITAGNYTLAKNVPLLLNTPFSIARTIGHEQLQTITFFQKEDQLEKIYSPVHKGHPGSFKGLNIMIIILESFSREHIGFLNSSLENGTYKGFTPFLDSLAGTSLMLDGFSNGKTSIQGIPAVLSGVPSLMNESFIQSNYAADKIFSLAGLLKKDGYTSAFFHGGTNGTMGFDSYTKITGFDHYFGRSEYNNDKDYDGKWGIRDEEFLQYTKRTIDGLRQPFMAAFFSLSSHHPYHVPDKYAGKFRKGKLPIQESIMYADYSLGKFFMAAEKMPWYKNTLFVITADHTSEGYYPYYQSDAGQYAIPILFFRPGEKLEGKKGETASQTDIMPSILDYLNFNRDYIAFGNSVFDSTVPHFSVHYISGIYSMMKDGFLLEFDGVKSTAFFNLRKDEMQKNNLAGKNLPAMKSMEELLKAYIQQYNNRLIENRMSTE